MTAVQNPSKHLTDIPQALLTAVTGDASPIDMQTAKVALLHFQEAEKDYKAWEQAAKIFNIEVPLKEDNAIANRVKIYQDAIESYYAHLNDAFLHQLNVTLKETEGMDYDQEARKKLSSVPQYKELEPLSHSKHNEAIRKFICENKDADIFDNFLFGSVGKPLLLEMLLDEGVKPAKIESPFITQCDMESLAWTTLISFNPNFPTDLGFCKLILKYHRIDTQGLTYLLWLACQSQDQGSEAQQLQVIQFLLSQGAQLNTKFISEYPLLGEKGPLSFINDTIRNSKKQILEFLLKAEGV